MLVRIGWQMPFNLKFETIYKTVAGFNGAWGPIGIMYLWVELGRLDWMKAGALGHHRRVDIPHVTYYL